MSYRYIIAQFVNSSSIGFAESIPTNMAGSLTSIVFDTEDQATEYINSLYQANPTGTNWYGIVPVLFIPNTQSGAVPYGTPAT